MNPDSTGDLKLLGVLLSIVCAGAVAAEECVSVQAYGGWGMSAASRQVLAWLDPGLGALCVILLRLWLFGDG